MGSPYKSHPDETGADVFQFRTHSRGREQMHADGNGRGYLFVREDGTGALGGRGETKPLPSHGVLGAFRGPVSSSCLIRVSLSSARPECPLVSNVGPSFPPQQASAKREGWSGQSWEGLSLPSKLQAVRGGYLTTKQKECQIGKKYSSMW